MSDNNPIIVTIRGGVADLYQKPEGVTVEIRDYDVEGSDEKLLTEDDNGNKYIASIFE